MRGSALHEFDLALSDYVRGNVRTHLDLDPGFVNKARQSRPTCSGSPVPIAKAVDNATSRRTDPFALYTGVPVAKGITLWLRDQLSLALWEYLVTDDRRTIDCLEDSAAECLLTEDDFDALARATEEMPLGLLCPRWSAYVPLHERYAECLPEIRRHLAGPVAEQFATKSRGWAGRLQRRGTKLWEGITTTGEWSMEVRRLLLTMNLDLLPRPQGRQPTPHHPEEQLGDDIQALVDRLRTKFNSNRELVTQVRNEVIRVVGGNRRKMLKALDWLARRGEYKPPATWRR